MLTKCEYFVENIVPSIRRELAYILYKKYGLSQSKIAELLGITQAAVSQYLRGARGKKYLTPKSRELIEELAKMLVEGKKNLSDLLCEICKTERKARGID